MSSSGSNASYSDIDMREFAEWQVELSKLKVAQLDELLGKKGFAVKGIKAEKVMQNAWNYTREEIAAWRRESRPTAGPPAMMAKRDRRQPTIDEFFK